MVLINVDITTYAENIREDHILFWISFVCHLRPIDLNYCVDFLCIIIRPVKGSFKNKKYYIVQLQVVDIFKSDMVSGAWSAQLIPTVTFSGF
jgi:hypothetical protein